MKAVIGIAVIFALVTAGAARGGDGERLVKRAGRYFEPLPAVMPGAEKDTPARIELGKRLFFDNRLSVNDTQSCAFCHQLDNGAAGVDNLPLSPGAKGELGTRNTPTVLNAGWQRRQFWDGRAADLVEQARGPILNPVEMAMPDEASVAKKIGAVADYQDAFAAAFPGEAQPVSLQNIAEAIAAFERTLRTESRFDDFLQGDVSALSEQEQRGLKTFIKLDCVSCHDGILLGGDSFEKLGKENAYGNQSDTGVYALTGDEDDRMVFKVAPLRNVALTAPYFHDGKIATLPEAVRQMGWLQLDRKLDDGQVEDISAFLGSLTDKAREKVQP